MVEVDEIMQTLQEHIAPALNAKRPDRFLDQAAGFDLVAQRAY
jgi:hypothetical protein